MYECGFATFAVEIVPGVTPVTVNLAVAQVNVAAPKVVSIVGAAVSLTTGRVAVSAPPRLLLPRASHQAGLAPQVASASLTSARKLRHLRHLSPRSPPQTHTAMRFR